MSAWRPRSYSAGVVAAFLATCAFAGPPLNDSFTEAATATGGGGQVEVSNVDATSETPTPCPTAMLPQGPFSEFGYIETQMRQIRRPNCWTLVVRGRLHNPYDEPVGGVRLIVRLRTAGEKPRELERIETELSIAIDPGQSAPFSRELTTFCTSMLSDVSVVAFASSRGAVELPTPSQEVELEASEIQEVAFSPGDIPIINNPGGFPPYDGH